jgi:Tol biopolymer transport system component
MAGTGTARNRRGRSRGLFLAGAAALGAVAFAAAVAAGSGAAPAAAGSGAAPAAAGSGSAPMAAASDGGAPLIDPREVHLADLRQLTFGGENAEAYWSPDSRELIFQSTRPPYACDQIFRMPADGSGEARLVSTGKGRTTCSYFTYPVADRILYSSTHLAGPDCPPPADRSHGYVWAIYPSYEIFSVRADGSDLVRMTDNDAYDAESTICPKDGSIVFTSTRDGDLDLYRMDADGGNVKRLTDTPGYDGGAFFSDDCTQIVWRASRPREGEELDDYRRLLGQGLVRPGQLELWVADADGTNARQVTYLGAASFAPYFFPGGERIIFSSNYGDPAGREFDLWAVNTDGTGLERITYAPEFDGFPIFSPDGRWLSFSSNRHHAKPGETNVFVARWVAGEAGAGSRGQAEARPADRFMAAVDWLADDAREGRGVGTQGLAASADWLAARFAEIGLQPAGEKGYRQPFEVASEVEVTPATTVAIDGAPLAREDFQPAGFSASASVAGEVVAAGYGITSPEHDVDDYAGVAAGGKIVVVRRFAPTGPPFDDTAVERRLSDLRYKAFNAREHGAMGLIVVDLPAGEEPPEEAPLPAPAVDSAGDAGLPVVVVSRAAGGALFAGGHRAALAVELRRQTLPAENIVGLLPAGAPDRLPGAVLIGAHYDHLGYGGHGSMDPDSHEVHNGADDNASGTAALLEAARQLAARRGELRRDVFFVAFSGEESGVLGSTYLTKHPVAGLELGHLEAMINMDMVGRLRNDRLAVLGADSAAEWRGMIDPLCRELELLCDEGGDGYGPSDQTPFYAAGVPVVHLFTGVHDDYHRASDDARLINAAGGAQVAALAADLAFAVAGRVEPLTYRAAPAPPPEGDVRSYGASLGTIPDYTGPGEGKKGVLLSGVRAGSPAEAAGIRRGDLLVALAGHPIGDIYDFVYVLRQAKPGQKATAVVERDGHRVELVVTFGESRGIR